MEEIEKFKKIVRNATDKEIIDIIKGVEAGYNDGYRASEIRIKKMFDDDINPADDNFNQGEVIQFGENPINGVTYTENPVSCSDAITKRLERRKIIGFKIRDIDRNEIYSANHNGEFENIYSHISKEYIDNIGYVYLYMDNLNTMKAGYLGSCDCIEDLSYYIQNYEIVFIYENE